MTEANPSSGRYGALELLLQPDDDDAVRPSPAQLGFCREAFAQLSAKLGTPGGGPAKILKEFDSLSASEKLSINSFDKKTSVARLPCNQEKNRYLNILPYDSTRVVLNASSNNSDQGSYINANFIGTRENELLPVYIATQGPLTNTLADFWEMVMQEQCPAIVMLTRLVDEETCMLKCDSYFPVQVNKSQIYGRIKVTAKHHQIHQSSVVMRLLEVQYIQSNSDPLSVLHIEYLNWPDYGVPTTTAGICQIFRKLYKIPPSFGPFIVHCSAGIGRTGTYCAIDYTLRRILLGDMSAVDIAKTVRSFRKQRLGMVQTKEQYLFCYKTIMAELGKLVANGEQSSSQILRD